MKLAGVTVVVTRAADQAGELTNLLEARGAKVIELPLFAVADPVDWSEADAALGEEWDLAVFPSKNAVERTLRRRAPSARWLAAVGEKTAAALGGREVIVPAKDFRAEGLLEALRARIGSLAGLRVLAPRGEEGRDALIEGLRSAGATVVAPIVYRTVPAPAPPAEVVEALALADVFTFLSGKTLDRFLSAVPDGRALLAGKTVCVIGPIARDRARALGVRVDVMPEVATVEALVEALDR